MPRIAPPVPELPLAQRLREALAALEAHATPDAAAGLARFGITAHQPLGVAMAQIQTIGKRCGQDHALAGALWSTAIYEARLLAAYVGDPDRLTPEEMDAWCAEFDNWGVCDTLCFKLFDRSPHAWGRVDAWAGRPEEFVRRAGFALLASLAGHARGAPDALFFDRLPLIAQHAGDERNFVKKGVSWALRRIGTRGPELHAAAFALAGELAADPRPSARWIGRDARADLSRPPKGRVRASATPAAPVPRSARRPR